MDRNMLEYYPLFLQGVREIEELFRGQQPEIEAADERVLKMLDECYIETASEYGIARWERIMGVKTPGEETLEERRFRLRLRLGNPEVYTIWRLKEFLGNLLGEDGYTVELFHREYRLKIRVNLNVKTKYEDALHYITDVAPANIIIDMSLLYNQHKTIKKLTHAQLKGLTHNEIRNEVL